MNVWTALTLALQLLLKMCLHVEAQALGECLFLKCFESLLCQLFKCHCIFFYLDYMVAAWDDKKIKKWKNIFPFFRFTQTHIRNDVFKVSFLFFISDTLPAM